MLIFIIVSILIFLLAFILAWRSLPEIGEPIKKIREWGTIVFLKGKEIFYSQRKKET